MAIAQMGDFGKIDRASGSIRAGARRVPSIS